MIEEIGQPERRVAQRDTDAEDELTVALKRISGLFRRGRSISKGEALRVKGKLARKDAHERTLKSPHVDLLIRGMEVIAREVSELHPDIVKQLLQSSDPSLLAGLARASFEDYPIDTIERMTLTGAERFQKLVGDSGGSVSSRWVSEFLGVSEAAVRKRSQRGSLIARRTASGDLSFPRFQFDDGNARVLPGISKLLTENNSWEPEELIRFLLVRHEPASNNETPLKLIQRGEVDRVVELAQVYMQQRA